MTLRGDVNAILNRLVRDDVISAFQTNFGTPAEAYGVHIIITPGSAMDRDGVRRAVTRALDGLSEQVTITVKAT
jgi:hypothetical protein